ncbi:MAG TPA: hypothetical protein VGQ76_20615 [Thermoanaerobaculia bacterium]|jgi:hypothetical protein|nr:hypothetical protein [Thermoanaerobaculia bacterium]
MAIAFPLPAADRQRIATINVAATSLFTFLGCYVQGRLQHRTLTRNDAARCFAAGTVAGVGFYQAKRFVADGDVTKGWLTANVATSIVENTTAGEHPLSRIGYTFGPFRLRVATPFDRARESYVDLDVSVAETMFLARAIGHADDIDIRDGMIAYETDRPLVENRRVFHGYTWGIFPGVWRGADEFTYRHEAVHAVQSLQLDSVEPPALTFHRTRRPFRLRHVRAGVVNLTDNIFNAGVLDYEDRWAEIEAYRLTRDQAPPP